MTINSANLISREPWIDIPGGDALQGWGHAEQVQWNQHLRQSEKARFFALSFDFIANSSVVGNYFEFGCHRVRTFRMALTEARHQNLGNTMKFFAFDSFEGLPTVDADVHDPNWKPGALRTSTAEFMAIIENHGLYLDRVELIKGFYKDSLSADLQKKFITSNEKIAIACIDCDLYDSAVDVFNFISPLIQEGTILYLDDYFAGYRGSPKKGVAKAFKEFEEKSEFSFIQHLQVGWGGRSFIAFKE